MVFRPQTFKSTTELRSVIAGHIDAGAKPAEFPGLGASPRRITAHHAGGLEEGAPRPSALGGY